VGSCALIAVKIKDKLFVANCGDSKAVILREADNTFTAIDASKTFNANKDYEQKRLYKLFPKEKDIVVCRSEKACYVKNALMPTRAIGDLRLKKKEINFHDFDAELGFKKPIA
jgi:serine/threonine protein phosphatase PrpC